MSALIPSRVQLSLLADAASALAGELDLDTVLDTIVAVAARVTGARYAALGVLGAGQQREEIVRFVTHGADAETIEAIGHYPTGKGLLGLLIHQPQILRLDDLRSHPESYGFPENHPPMTSFLGAPVRSAGQVYGNLYLTEKPGGFDEVDEQLIAVLASQAGAAVEGALLSARLQELAVHQERERISRDLHDGAIQRLFSVGMGLQSARALVDVEPSRAQERIEAAIDGVDQTIRDLRGAIFHLRAHEGAALGLAGGLAELAREHEVNALVRPVLDHPSDLDARVPARLVPDLLAVTREALSNAAKHAKARSIVVAVEIGHGELRLSVTDDGTGFAAGQASAGRGLGTMRERVEGLGGALTVASEPGRGTAITALVPLDGR